GFGNRALVCQLQDTDPGRGPPVPSPGGRSRCPGAAAPPEKNAPAALPRRYPGETDGFQGAAPPASPPCGCRCQGSFLGGCAAPDVYRQPRGNARLLMRPSTPTESRWES